MEREKRDRAQKKAFREGGTDAHEHPKRSGTGRKYQIVNIVMALGKLVVGIVMLATQRTNRIPISMSRMRLAKKLKSLLLKIQLRLSPSPRSLRSSLLKNSTRARELSWITRLTRDNPGEVK